jgi:glycosyltransferase involved in cell wall biosynthesis
MGEVTLVGDPEALAEAILRVIRHPDDYARPRRLIEETFSLERTAASYEALFESLVGGRMEASQPVKVGE